MQIWEGPRRTKVCFFLKKDQVGNFPLNIKTYYITMVIKIVWYLGNKRCTLIECNRQTRSRLNTYMAN